MSESLASQGNLDTQTVVSALQPGELTRDVAERAGVVPENEEVVSPSMSDAILPVRTDAEEHTSTDMAGNARRVDGVISDAASKTAALQHQAEEKAAIEQAAIDQKAAEERTATEQAALDQKAAEEKAAAEQQVALDQKAPEEKAKEELSALYVKAVENGVGLQSTQGLTTSLDPELPGELTAVDDAEQKLDESETDEREVHIVGDEIAERAESQAETVAKMHSGATETQTEIRTPDQHPVPTHSEHGVGDPSLVAALIATGLMQLRNRSDK